MNVLVKISQQTAWQIIGKITTALSTIIILGLISRQFGEEGTGIITLALAYLGFFSLAVDFGINAHILPQLLKGDVNIIWRKLFGLRIILAVSLVVSAALLILFWPNQASVFKITVLMGLVSITEAAVFISATALFQSRLRYDLTTSATILGTVTTLGSLFFLIKLNSVPLLMAGYVFGWIVTAGAALLLVKKIFNDIRPIFDLSFSTRTINNVWPISITLLINLIYFRADAFLLSYFKSFTEVGIYNLSYQIFQSLLVLPTYIMNSFYPLLLKDFSSSLLKFKESLLKGVLLMAAIGFLGTVGTIFLASIVVQIITGGHGFSGSVSALQILSLGLPAFFVSSLLMWSLIALKQYRPMMIIYLAGLLINVLLNVIFIPRYSYLAAAGVTVVSEYLILILQLIILRKQNLR